MITIRHCCRCENVLWKQSMKSKAIRYPSNRKIGRRIYFQFHTWYTQETDSTTSKLTTSYPGDGGGSGVHSTRNPDFGRRRLHIILGHERFSINPLVWNEIANRPLAVRNKSLCYVRHGLVEINNMQLKNGHFTN